MAAVAAVSAGATLVPINPKLGRAELLHVFTDSEPDVLLGAPGSGRADAAAPASPPRGRRRCASRGELPDTVAADEDPALIVYTSGTTGRPKGAILPRRALASNLDALADAWDWTDAGRPRPRPAALPRPRARGRTVRHSAPRWRASPPRRVRPGNSGRGPSRRRHDDVRCPDDVSPSRPAGRDGPRRSGRVCAARACWSRVRLRLPAPEFERIRRLTGQEIVERYGMTETLMNLAVRVDGVRRPGRVGVPLPGVEVRLIDDDGQELDASDGETMGEVVVRGPNLFTRLPQPTGGDRRGAARRLVPHRRPRHARPRRLLADRRTAGDRPDQDRWVQGRRR